MHLVNRTQVVSSDLHVVESRYNCVDPKDLNEDSGAQNEKGNDGHEQISAVDRGPKLDSCRVLGKGKQSRACNAPRHQNLVTEVEAFENGGRQKEVGEIKD